MPRINTSNKCTYHDVRVCLSHFIRFAWKNIHAEIDTDDLVTDLMGTSTAYCISNEVVNASNSCMNEDVFDILNL